MDIALIKNMDISSLYQKFAFTLPIAQHYGRTWQKVNLKSLQNLNKSDTFRNSNFENEENLDLGKTLNNKIN